MTPSRGLLFTIYTKFTRSLDVYERFHADFRFPKTLHSVFHDAPEIFQCLFRASRLATIEGSLLVGKSRDFWLKANQGRSSLLDLRPKGKNVKSQTHLVACSNVKKTLLRTSILSLLAKNYLQLDCNHFL